MESFFTVEAQRLGSDAEVFEVLFGEVVDETAKALHEGGFVKIHEESDAFVAHAKVGENLCVVDWFEGFDGFDFDDDGVVYEEVDAVGVGDFQVFVVDGEMKLVLNA